jgi:CheY-like chemotaxis protein
MPTNRVLLVDDDEVVRMTLTAVLEQSGFAVTCARNVVEALSHITSGSYDVLVSDLHMPGAGDGLTVVSAMRHANPSAVTLLLSAFPQMEAAAQAILLQADEILVKPMELTSLVDIIKHRVAVGPVRHRKIESVAAILERTTEATIQEWYRLIQTAELVMSIPMPGELRCAHLRPVLRDIASRLLSSKPIGTREFNSATATEHGRNRRCLGYSAPMLVEESRMLQVSIFQTLQNNLASIDFSLLLIGVMTIADEVDSQLSQAMAGFTAALPMDGLAASVDMALLVGTESWQFDVSSVKHGTVNSRLPNEPVGPPFLVPPALA